MEELRIPLEGIDRDTHNLQRKEGAYTFALNATSSSKRGDALSLQNEMGNIKCYDFKDFKLVGSTYVSELNKHLVFLTNESTSRIGLFSYGGIKGGDYEFDQYCQGCQKTSFSHLPVASCSFELLVEAACLNFSPLHQVTCEYKLTDCTFNIYFRDGYNENRFLYFDKKGTNLFLQNRFKVGYKNDCNGEVYTEALNCTYAGWYQRFDVPTLTTRFENGGSLKEGVYQVLFAWSTSKGVALSSYKSLTTPIPLFKDVLKTETNAVTSKGLLIQLDPDTNVLHEFYNLVIVETVDNATSYFQVTLPKDQKEYFYTGNTPGAALIRVDENTVFQKYPYYKYSDFMTQANGYLIQVGMTEYEKFNLQPIVNKVQIGWHTVQLKEGDYADPTIAQNYRGYLRDEVYAFGLMFELDNGEETPPFPLIGPEPTFQQRQGIIDPIDNDPLNANKWIERWRRFNTATLTATPHTPYNKQNLGIWEEGEFGVFESTDSYPNNREVWGDQCGKKIKLFRMPDSYVSHHHSGKDFVIPNDYITLLPYPTTYIYPLGVHIKSNIEALLNEGVASGIITQQQRDRIRGYKLIRANRFGNRSIQAKGWIYNTREYTKEGTTYRFPNYPYNDLRPDAFIARTDKREAPSDPNLRTDLVRADNKPYYTFHSPDTHFSQQSLGSFLKIEAESYGFSRGTFKECLEEAEHKILSQRHYNFAIVLASVMARAYQPNSEHLSGSSQSIGQGVGSAAGAVIGSIIPGVGTAIGATLGGMLGGFIGSVAGDNSDRLKAGPRAIMWLAQTEKILQLISLSVPFWQNHYQYQSTGKYFAFKTAPNDSNRFFKIENWRYLSPETTTLPTKAGSLMFNNWQRESSVYLETDRALPNPTVEDVSRNTRRQLFGNTGDNLKFMISSQYVSIKNEVRNQYGTVFNFRWLTTGSKTFKLHERAYVFGGDTFINAFAIKRKHRFFIASTYGAGNGSDVYYEDLGNAGYPLSWFNTRNVDAPPLDLLQGLEFLPNLGTTINDAALSLTAAKSIMDLPGKSAPKDLFLNMITLGIFSLFKKKEKSGDKLVSEFMEDINDFFQAQLLSPDKYFRPARYSFDLTLDYSPNLLSTVGVQGVMYLYSFGIPTYICESDINIDFRHAENNREKDFYPNQSNLDEWLQEKYVPFAFDNYFFYNKSYSKQPSEHSYVMNDINFKPYEECKTYYPTKVIYSLQDSELEDNQLRDNWLINRALDYENLSLDKGRVTGINQLENDKVLLRFEDGVRMFPAYTELRATDQSTVQIGNGGLFKSKPITFAETDYGYYGSQHRAFLSTEYGHISVDAKRGQIFILGSNGEVTDEITRYGLRRWFEENLPFQINKHFSEVNIDNLYQGIGINMVYDRELKRILFTKLDYKPKRKGITYQSGSFYFNGQKVELSDPLFFYNLSWTISYDLELKKFRSWHSYTPNLYLGGVNEFFSTKGNEIWVHNQSNKLYQNFYGQQYPFIIDGFAKPNVQRTVLKSVSFSTDSIQFLNDYDERHTNVTFEEAIVYNNHQNSGLLILDHVDKNNLTDRIQYPIATPEATRVILDHTNEEYSFNQFNDKSINQLSYWLYDSVQVNKKINPESVAYFKNELSCIKLKAQMHFVRLINHTNSTNSIIVKYIKLNHNAGLRN